MKKRNELNSIPNVKLVQKIAWIFYFRTGFEYQELFQEAILCYYEVLTTYSPEKGQISTYLTHCIQNRLNNFIVKERKHPSLPEFYREETCKISPWWEWEGVFTGKVKELVEFVLEGAEQIDLQAPPKMIRGQIARVLMELGWKGSEIWTAYRDLKNILATIK